MVHSYLKIKFDLKFFELFHQIYLHYLFYFHHFHLLFPHIHLDLYYFFLVLVKVYQHRLLFLGKFLNNYILIQLLHKLFLLLI